MVSPTVMVAPECNRPSLTATSPTRVPLSEPEVAQQPTFVGLAQFGVEARGVRIIEHHVIGRAGPNTYVRNAQYVAFLRPQSEVRR